MKRVLIALDYKPGAQKLAEYGFSFAKAMKAEITLLHVILDPLYYTHTDHVEILGFAGHLDIPEDISEKSPEPKKIAQHFLNKLKLYLDDKSIQTLLMEGDCAENILSEAKRINADVIIMGSVGTKWIANAKELSTTYKVLHKSTTPVLIIPI